MTNIIVLLVLGIFSASSSFAFTHDKNNKPPAVSIKEQKNLKTPDYHKNRLIVKYKVKSGAAEEAEAFFNKGKPAKTLSVRNTLNRTLNKKNIKNIKRLSKKDSAFVVDLSNVPVNKNTPIQDSLSMAKEMRLDPNVEYAYPDYKFEVSAVDPMMGQQWALNKTKTPLAWNQVPPVAPNAPEVVIAIVDTGVDYNHEDLVDKMWRNTNEIPNNNIDDDLNGFVDDIQGWDFAADPLNPDYPNQPNDPMDHFGHGTHCAGIAAANTNNGIGIAGVCPTCKIMNVKAADGNWLYLSDIFEAIDYAIDNGAHIISMSFGAGARLEDTPDNNYFTDILRRAIDKKIVLVAAAGNNYNSQMSFPAASTGVISVAATGSNDERAPFSTYGHWVSIGAPGQDILSTMLETGVLNNPSGYGVLNGTSMACPFVAGVAGLIMSKNPLLKYNASQVRNMILGTSDDQLPLVDKYIGSGRVNSLNAIKADPTLKADITAPATNADLSVNGEVIRGSTVGISYTLSYGQGLYPAVWQPFLTGMGNKTNAQLGVFQPDAAENGVYSIKLSVFNSFGDSIHDKTQGYYEPQIQRITEDHFLQREAAVFDNKVVWTEVEANVGGWKLKMKNLNTGVVSIIKSSPNPIAELYFNDNKILWNTNYDIYMYNLETGIETQLTNDAAAQSFPAVSGSYVVWHHTSDWVNGNIYLYDLSSSTLHQITTHPGNQKRPRISGRHIVWEDYRYQTHRGEIFYAHFTPYQPIQEKQLTSNSNYYKARPFVSGDYLVWHDGTYDWNEVMLFDLTKVNDPTYHAQRLSNKSDAQYNPIISDNRVIWVDNDDQDLIEVYMDDLNQENHSPRKLFRLGENYSSNVNDMPAIHHDTISFIRNNDVYVYKLCGGLNLCGDQCVDLITDPQNCGACGAICDGYQAACHNSQCFDLANDHNNCGGIDTVCTDGQECLYGSCVTSCSDTEERCNGNACVNILNDNYNCGGCGNYCSSPEQCTNGVCAKPEGLYECGGGTWSDCQFDNQNCGSCGISCQNGQSCHEGQCVCPSETTDCGGSCVDVTHDGQHCGACGNVCADGWLCEHGACALQCDSGYTACSESCTYLPSDSLNCGTCGHVCPENSNCDYGLCMVDGETSL